MTIRPRGDVDPTGALHARLGQPFPLELPSHPTTGYEWTLETGGSVRVAERSFRPGGPGLGGGGADRFLLEPRELGTFRLEFRYRRPWDGHVAETREYVLKVAPGE